MNEVVEELSLECKPEFNSCSSCPEEAAVVAEPEEEEEKVLNFPSTSSSSSPKAKNKIEELTAEKADEEYMTVEAVAVSVDDNEDVTEDEVTLDFGDISFISNMSTQTGPTSEGIDDSVALHAEELHAREQEQVEQEAQVEVNTHTVPVRAVLVPTHVKPKRADPAVRSAATECAPLTALRFVASIVCSKW